MVLLVEVNLLMTTDQMVLLIRLVLTCLDLDCLIMMEEVILLLVHQEALVLQMEEMVEVEVTVLTVLQTGGMVILILDRD